MDIVIVGAGAAGLSAAVEISKSHTVHVVEARDRVGGRIHTLKNSAFSMPVELGAEFIHGDLPVTTSLLREAGIRYLKGDGNMWNIYDGNISSGDSFDEHWNEMLEALKKLDRDMSIADFMRQHFGDSKYDQLRETVDSFVSGYDAANPEKASALSLREEWLAEDDLTGYHPEGGYTRLMQFLYAQCLENKVTFHLNTKVSAIRWEKGSVQVITSDNKTFNASKAIITIPPAVLKTGVVSFSPEIADHMNAIQKIETGGVIKFLVEFHEPYWENGSNDFRQMKDLHFLFSDAPIPTWWTQRPNTTPLLTGWLAGPVLDTINQSDNALRQMCLQSLSYLFNCKEDVLDTKIRTLHIVNWLTDEYSHGAYAYRSVEGKEALKVLSRSVAETLYFAGEAYYEGPEMGTVEAALKSGRHVLKS